MDNKLIVQNFSDQYAEKGIYFDDFQNQAITAIAKGEDVLVCAPTGAGKTIVAEFGVELALAHGQKCIYTAPVKALSNQKYQDLVARLGANTVGLLTGDQTINRDGQILVVTTEVLRNILFQQDSFIFDVGYVVLDEVHYLADKSRGPVWEEIILQLPPHVCLISLSATIANIDEFSSWLHAIRGTTATVVTTERPVPLNEYIYHKGKILPAPQAMALIARQSLPPGRNKSRIIASQRKTVLRTLGEQQLLPVIEFIFSRRGCDRAVQDLLDSNVIFTDKEQQKIIKNELKQLRREFNDEDARAIKFHFWAKALTRGFSAHHAGIFPAFKELTEKLMMQGLLQVVYATGTLSLGIDMPVRSVVLEDCIKFNGEDFSQISVTEYKQLIGRAGRRGKDSCGNAVIFSAGITHSELLAEYLAGEVEPLQSAFYPAYNTVINLVNNYGREQAREIMGTSFAQYQKNAELGEIAGRITRIKNLITLEENRLRPLCFAGDLPNYLRLRQTAGRASKAQRRQARASYRQDITQSWKNVETGTLYAYARYQELEYGVALSAPNTKDKYRFINIFGDVIWLRLTDLNSPLRKITALELPFGRSFKQREVRMEFAENIFSTVAERVDLGIDRDLLFSWDRFATKENTEIMAHGVHSCPDLKAHIRAGEEFLALEKQLSNLQFLTEKFSESVAKEYDKTLAVLTHIGYLQAEKMGLGADYLRGIHNEYDLLISLLLNEQIMMELKPAEFAGICAVFVSRNNLSGTALYTPALRDAAKALERNYEYLSDLELRYELELTPEPNYALVEAIHAWAAGADLATVLRRTRMDVGDFITLNRRLIDLLQQLVGIGKGTWVADSANQAITQLKRWTWI